MLLNRNNNSSSGKGSNWLVWPAIICILGVIAFGARHKIKAELYEIMVVDQERIEKIVHEFIDKNPKVIINSLQEMQRREHEEMMKQAQMKIQDNKDALQGKGTEFSTFSGNKDGDIVITTFLDYRCGYCKHSNRDLKELIKQDPKVKIIFKELPVLGPPSQKLSKMALAIYLIDNKKYIDFHNAVMDSDEPDDKSIEAILKNLNLDSAKVSQMMLDSRIQKELDSIVSLAGQLGVRGTPAFIIDEELIPGAIDLNSLLAKIKDARAKKTTDKK